MTTLAIELTDTGVVAVAEGGIVAGPSPGYAYLEGDAILLGTEARARARLNPRRSLNRFWDELGSGGLHKPFPEALTQADLGYRHLEEVARRAAGELGGADSIDEVLLAVPGSFQSWQLGLLLGMARSAGLPVVGLVDSALAAVSTYPTRSRVLHLELLLHRAIWTEIDTAGGLVRRRVEEVADVGLAMLFDSWAKAIAKQFVRSTRFDPLHHAASEQTLYDSLPGWIEELRERGAADLDMVYGDRTYGVEMSKPQFIAAVREPLDALTARAAGLFGAGEPAQILLSPSSARLLGVRSSLLEMGAVEIEGLAPGSGAAGALSHRDQIASEGEELPFVLRLASRSETPSAAGERATEPARRSAPSIDRPPTHLVYRGLAYAIPEEPFWLGTALGGEQQGLNLSGNTAGISRSHCSVVRRDERVIVEDHSTYGTFLNDRPIDGTSEAAVGDRLRLGSPGIEITLIALVETDG